MDADTNLERIGSNLDSLENAGEADEHPLVVNSAEGWSSLHLAVARGRLRHVRRLLDAGLRPDGRSQHTGACGGCTALHVATAMGEPDLVQLLLDAGARADLRDEAGLTPLHMAAQRGDLAIVRALLRAGADPEPWVADHTPLDLARLAGHGQVVALLRQVSRRPTPRSR